MTDIKAIYKEASKETVENLINNSSKTIEDLYKKVVEDISIFEGTKCRCTTIIKTGYRAADEYEVYINRPYDQFKGLFERYIYL